MLPRVKLEKLKRAEIFQSPESVVPTAVQIFWSLVGIR
jgi:hypothetical protein